MSSVGDLYWLPERVDWGQALKGAITGAKEPWNDLRTLSLSRLDFLKTGTLDRALVQAYGMRLPENLETQPIRLAILSSHTVDHLLPGLRVGALRHGIHLSGYIAAYGQYFQELRDPKSDYYAFAPNVTLFSFDAAALLGAADASRTAADVEKVVEAAVSKLSTLWSLAIEATGGQVIQQTILPTMPPLLGSNEHRLPGSQRWLIECLNYRLREAADAAGVDILALDIRLAQDGLASWHSPVLWHRAKQEISPAAAGLYGEYVARLITAQKGRSKKCLVLDLDNTLWGGVIGDDGLNGIVLGQGSALGEAFVAFQSYAKELSMRGIILAVCSKNDESNALAPFSEHPEMVLRTSDIACFVANWQDKPANIKIIAERLNIGIDSLVFADDNPFERNIVRRELPAVSVPELPEDPALYARCIADAGYFEGVRLSADDFERSRQYQANLERANLMSSTTDLGSYLKSLNMELIWESWNPMTFQRVVQLINKTNQFNLTTRRYTEAQAQTVLEDSSCLRLSFRLTDAFGDNGIIGIAIAKPLAAQHEKLVIDTWLMSCRVLGRQVEEAMLNVIVDQSRRLKASHLVGEFIPSAKNGMVKNHYQKLGFAHVSSYPDGATVWQLPIASFETKSTHMRITKATDDRRRDTR